MTTEKDKEYNTAGSEGLARNATKRHYKKPELIVLAQKNEINGKPTVTSVEATFTSVGNNYTVAPS